MGPAWRVRHDAFTKVVDAGDMTHLVMWHVMRHDSFSGRSWDMTPSFVLRYDSFSYGPVWWDWRVGRTDKRLNESCLVTEGVMSHDMPHDWRVGRTDKRLNESCLMTEGVMSHDMPHDWRVGRTDKSRRRVRHAHQEQRADEPKKCSTVHTRNLSLSRKKEKKQRSQSQKRMAHSQGGHMSHVARMNESYHTKE